MTPNNGMEKEPHPPTQETHYCLCRECEEYWKKILASNQSVGESKPPTYE